MADGQQQPEPRCRLMAIKDNYPSEVEYYLLPVTGRYLPGTTGGGGVENKRRRSIDTNIKAAKVTQKKEKLSASRTHGAYVLQALIFLQFPVGLGVYRIKRDPSFGIAVNAPSVAFAEG